MDIGARCAAPPETPSVQQADPRSRSQSPKSCPLASLRVVGVGSLPRCDAALRVVGAASQHDRAAVVGVGSLGSHVIHSHLLLLLLLLLLPLPQPLPPPPRPRRLPEARPQRPWTPRRDGATPRQAARELRPGSSAQGLGHTAWFPNKMKLQTMVSPASARLKAPCLATSMGGGKVRQETRDAGCVL